MAHNGFTDMQKRIVVRRDMRIAGNNIELLCWFCGACSEDDRLDFHHRKNRQMGGDKTINRISNCISLCALCNLIIEQGSVAGARAETLGIKIRNTTKDFTEIPVRHAFTKKKYLLDDNGGYKEINDE